LFDIHFFQSFSLPLINNSTSPFYQGLQSTVIGGIIFHSFECLGATGRDGEVGDDGIDGKDGNFGELHWNCK